MASTMENFSMPTLGLSFFDEQFSDNTTNFSNFDQIPDLPTNSTSPELSNNTESNVPVVNMETFLQLNFFNQSDNASTINNNTNTVSISSNSSLNGVSNPGTSNEIASSSPNIMNQAMNELEQFLMTDDLNCLIDDKENNANVMNWQPSQMANNGITFDAFENNTADNLIPKEAAPPLVQQSNIGPFNEPMPSLIRSPFIHPSNDISQYDDSFLTALGLKTSSSETPVAKEENNELIQSEAKFTPPPPPPVGPQLNTIPLVNGVKEGIKLNSILAPTTIKTESPNNSIKLVSLVKDENGKYVVQTKKPNTVIKIGLMDIANSTKKEENHNPKLKLETIHKFPLKKGLPVHLNPNIKFNDNTPLVQIHQYYLTPKNNDAILHIPCAPKKEIEVIDLTSPKKSTKRPLPTEDTSFQVHKKKNGTTPTTLICPKCYIIMPSKAKIKKHLDLDHDIEKVIECLRCDQIYLTKSHLADHVQIAHSSFECRECGEKFVTRSKWETHISEGHKNANPFRCRDCGLCFKQESFYLTHLRVRHNKAFKYQCMMCNSTFIHRKSLASHLRSVHRNLHACVDCYKTFSSPPELQKHVSSDECIPANPFLNHMTVVPEEPSPFRCLICKATYRGRSNLEKHLISVHNLTMSQEGRLNQPPRRPIMRPAPKVTCSACRDIFRSQSALNDHMRKVHFACQRCPSIFASERSLRLHNPTHTKRNVLPCTQCELQFPSKVQLNDHLNGSHMKVVLFFCYECDLSFPFASGLRFHNEKDHNERPFPGSDYSVKIKTDSVQWHLGAGH